MKLISIINNFSELTVGEEIYPDPIFTILPDTAMLRNNDPFYIPEFSQRIDASVHLLVKISRVVKHIEPKFAARCYDEIGLAVSFIARDRVVELQESSLPWDIAQSFDKSTAISPQFITKEQLEGSLDKLTFDLCIDGQAQQEAKVGDARFSIDDIISYVSRFTTLKIGDLILCGAPSNAIDVKEGNTITAHLDGEQLLNFEIR